MRSSSNSRSGFKRSLSLWFITFTLFSCGESDPAYDPTVSTVSAERPGEAALAERTEKADRWRKVIPRLSDEEVIVARISLGEARGDSVDSARQFLDAFEPISDERRPDFEGEIKEGLKGTLTARRLMSRGESGVLRQDRFIAQGELDALKLTQSLRESFAAIPLLPFRMSAGAEVTFSRVFEDQERANQARQLTPLHLPFTRDRALALPEGTMVQMPVEAQMSLNLNGKHLSRSWQNVRELAQLLKSSASGFTSAAVQGVLMMNGSFTITITRHHDNLVRVLVQRSQERRGGAGGEVSAEVTFFPAATVDRIRSLRERLSKWSKRPSEHLQGWGERLRALRRSVSTTLRPLLDDARVESYPKEVRDALAFAEMHLDPALDMLESGEMTVDVASSWIEEQVESALGVIDETADPILGEVKRHSERAFNARLAVELSAESSEQIGVLGDYILDLSTEAGVIAFESMLSGRAQWEGILAGRGVDLGLIDLTLVDGLVSEDIEGVRCLRRAELKTKKRRVNINIQSPLSSWHFATQRQDHDLEIEVDGRSERWAAEQWSVNRGLNVFGLDRDETLVSGQLAQLDEGGELDEEDELNQEESADTQSADEEWTYWMSWSKQWPKRARTPVSEAFSEALNLSGSVGVSQGLAQHFFTEADGALNAQFTLVFYEGFLTELMERADPDLIWEAAAATAQTFERRGGLPYAPAFTTPDLSERATAACEVITERWGKRYCRIIYFDLIEPLIEIRESTGSLDDRRRAQRDWLASLYERRFILNPIGTRVTARLMCELATLMGREGEVSLRLRLQHPSSPEVSLDVSLEGGATATPDQPIHALEIAEWLGLGEGITYWP